MDYIAPCLRGIYASRREEILAHFRTALLVYCESHRCDKAVDEVLPVLPSLFKLYRPPPEVKATFIEILAKLIFDPSREVVGKELVQLCEALQELLKGRFTGGFTLPWEPVLQLLDTIFNEQRRATEYFTKKEKLRLKLSLQKIVHKLRNYFTVQSGMQVYRYVKPFIGPEKARKGVYLLYFNWLVRTDAGVPKEQYEGWMKELLLLWDCNSLNKEVAAVALSVISRLAMSHYEINWDLYVDKLFSHIMKALPFHLKKFDFLINAYAGLVPSEDRIYSNITTYAAKLAVALMRPHPEGKSKAYYGIKRILNTIKLELYPAQKNVRMTLTPIKFVQRLLISMCHRLQIQNDLEEKYKLQRVDVIKFTELIMRILDPVLFNLCISNIFAACIYFISSLCPEIAFDHYTPKLLKLLDDSSRSHDATLCQLNALSNALMFNSTFDRKYYYIGLILDYAIKEINTVTSDASLFALNIAGRIFTFLPLIHKKCLADEYARVRGSVKSYEEYVNELNGLNELEYYYHKLMNGIEERVVNVLEKLFTILKFQETPTKESSRMLVTRIHVIMLGIYSNSSNEVFETVLRLFKDYITSGPFPNARKEIAVIVSKLAKRDPVATANVVIPYCFQNLTSTEPDGEIWDSFLGKYIKQVLPEAYVLAHKYSLKNYLSSELNKYYSLLINAVMLDFPECFDYHKEHIMTLVTLTLLNPKKSAAKITAKVLNTLLQSKLTFQNRAKTLAEQVRWREILDAHKSIGQHDAEMLQLQWRRITKQDLVFSKQLIELFCLGLGECVLEGLAKSPGSESSGAAVAWIQIARKVIPACGTVTAKTNCIFSITRTLLEDKAEGDMQLVDFFHTLRSRLLILANKIVPAIMPNFYMNIVQRLPKLALDCFLSIICLPHRYEEPKRPVDSILLKLEKTMYRSPIKRDYIRKYLFYYENAEKLPLVIANCLERSNEVPADELKEAICFALDILIYTPNPVSSLSDLVAH